MRKLFFILPMTIIFFFAGCGTTQLQLNSTMSRTVVLDPIKQTDKVVYLKVRNGAMSKIDILPSLKKELFKREVILTDDPQKAKYWLDVNVLFANSLREAQALKAATDAGVTAGITTGVSTGNGRDGLIVGVLTAVLVGGIAHATEDEIYRAVIDISIKERIDQKVEATHEIGDNGSTVYNKKVAGFGNEIASEPLDKKGGGSLNDGLSSLDKYSYNTNYIQHKTRIFVSAVQMGLKLEKAIPLLEKRAAYQIAEIFR